LSEPGTGRAGDDDRTGESCLNCFFIFIVLLVALPVLLFAVVTPWFFSAFGPGPPREPVRHVPPVNERPVDTSPVLDIEAPVEEVEAPVEDFEAPVVDTP
jgi:hypothetical protein